MYCIASSSDPPTSTASLSVGSGRNSARSMHCISSWKMNTSLTSDLSVTLSPHSHGIVFTTSTSSSSAACFMSRRDDSVSFLKSKCNAHRRSFCHRSERR